MGKKRKKEKGKRGGTRVKIWNGEKYHSCLLESYENLVSGWRLEDEEKRRGKEEGKKKDRKTIDRGKWGKLLETCIIQ